MKNKKFKKAKPVPAKPPKPAMQLSVGAALTLGDGHTFAASFEAPVANPGGLADDGAVARGEGICNSVGRTQKLLCKTKTAVKPPS